MAAERINEERPKLVVGNHPFMVTALTMSREQFGLEVPVIHFQTTTLEVTSLWAFRTPSPAWSCRAVRGRR